MKRVYFKSSYYNEILHELRGSSLEIRDELDLCATEVGDFEEDEFLEFELWKTASDAMEEWLEDNTPFYLDYDVLDVNENTGAGFVRFNGMKGLNTVLHLYKDASNYTEWFVPQVEQLQQQAVKLFLGVDRE